MKLIFFQKCIYGLNHCPWFFEAVSPENHGQYCNPCIHYFDTVTMHYRTDTKHCNRTADQIMYTQIRRFQYGSTTWVDDICLLPALEALV